jgi:hypothetical protein
MAHDFYIGRLGLKLDTTHTYRVVVEYDNPTADTIRGGGMGVVGGAFLPGDTPLAPADTSEREACGSGRPFRARALGAVVGCRGSVVGGR